VIWLALLPTLAQAGPEVSVEGDVAIHGQVFVAPNLATQDAHTLGGPLIGVEAELRIDDLGIRPYLAVWPLPGLATLGALVVVHREMDPGTWYLGLDGGLAYAFRTPRVVGGPTIGLRRELEVGQLSSIVGLRATIGVGYDLSTTNDWVFLQSGRSVGVHASVVLTMRPTPL